MEISEPTARVQLFGKSRVFLGKHEVRFERRKTVALLAYLAVNNTSVLREQLVRFLWPDATSKVSFSGLRNLLVGLNASLLAPWIIAERETVELAAALQVDVRQFHGYLHCLRQAHCSPDRLSVECLLWMERQQNSTPGNSSPSSASRTAPSSTIGS